MLISLRPLVLGPLLLHGAELDLSEASKATKRQDHFFCFMAAGVVYEGGEVLRDPCVEVTLGAEDELVIHGESAAALPIADLDYARHCA